MATAKWQDRKRNLYTIEIASPTTKQTVQIQVHATAPDLALSRLRTATMRVVAEEPTTEVVHKTGIVERL